jgi:hypothetical protein
MDLQDRLTRGLVAGIAAGIVLDIIHYLSFLLGIVELTYFDWASVVVFGTRTTNAFELFLAVVVQLFFAGLVGVLFVYFITWVTSKNLLLKAVVFSLAVWFFANGIAHTLKVTPLMPIRGDSSLRYCSYYYLRNYLGESNRMD